MLTAEVAVGQTPLDTVHKNEFIPALNPETCEEVLLVEVIFPVPVLTDQRPLPRVRVMAVNVAVLAHIV